MNYTQVLLNLQHIKTIQMIGTSLTYLLISVKVVLMIRAHTRVRIVAARVASLARVQASHHTGI